MCIRDRARLAALSLAIVLSALLVNAVGIIGFIGLFAPLLAKMLGARRLLARLMLAPLIGALILWLSDQIILWLTRVWMELSTGSVTALIGAPLLLWLLPRLRSMSAPDMNASNRIAAERQNVLMFALAGGAILLLTVIVALAFGRDAHGWTWASGAMLDELMPWRWPRILAALVAGVMLAVAGCIIQRLTGNPMASPEVLGISSGAVSYTHLPDSLCQQGEMQQQSGNPFDQSTQSQPQQQQQQQQPPQQEKKDSDGVAGWIKDMFGSN